MLSSLVEDGDIEPEKAEYGREKYTEIHTALIESMSDESRLLEDAKKLHGKLEVGTYCVFQFRNMWTLWWSSVICF